MSERTKSPVVPLVVALVAALAVIVVLLAQRGSDGEEPAAADRDRSGSTGGSTEDDPLAQLPRREPGDPLAKGPADAPVVMVAYSDFQCPYCGKFARETEPVLEEKYVEPGVLRIEWRDFPYLGKESVVAARAGRAAAIQGHFWDFHDALYDNQLPPNSGHLDEDYLTGIAEDLGMDPDRFRAGMDAAEARFAVSRDFEEGQRVGVTGTPAFVINGEPVMGAQPVEVFEKVIEQAADDAGA